MGRGIAYAAVAGGFRAVLTDVSGDALAKAPAYVRETLATAKERGKWSGDIEAAVAALALTARLEDAAAELIIEAVPEEMRLKVETSRALNKWRGRKRFWPATLLRSRSPR